jgi:hypothetical protein
MIDLLVLLMAATPSPVGYDATELLPNHSTTPFELAQVVDLSQCVAGEGLLPGNCFFPIWKRPWVLNGETINGSWTDRELRDTVYANVGVIVSHFAAGPALSFTSNEKIVTRAHLVYWMAFEVECDECYTVRPLEPWERELVAKQAGLLGLQGTFEYSITSQDLWRDQLSLSQSMDALDKRGYPRAVAFLNPSMLGYMWAPDRNALLVARLDRKPSDSEPTPSWVWDSLDHNPAFVCRAKAIVAKSGLTWKGWMERHGYVPGDRTPLDMQYNTGLRWATRPYLIDTFQPFGKVMPYEIDWGLVYQEEKRRWFEEESEANQLVDRYLGNCR